MIDQTKIDSFRAMEPAEGKAALSEYGKELGVSLKQSWTFDKMLAKLEDATKPSVVEGDIPAVDTVSSVPAEPIVQDPTPPVPAEIIDYVPPMYIPPMDSPTEVIGPDPQNIGYMSFEMVGESFPWAWNMRNVQDAYWYGHTSTNCFVEHIETHGDKWTEVDSDDAYTAYLSAVVKSSSMVIILRDMRSDNFYLLDASGYKFDRYVNLVC